MMVSVSFIAESGWAQKTEFFDEVVAALDKRIEVLRKEVAEHPAVIQTVRDANATHSALSRSTILEQDRQWQAGGAEELVRTLVTNACAKRLLEFQEAHEGYAEIFVADAQGLVIGATNRTSDYYQADEDWWVQGYAEGRGKAFYGEIEYDESAMSESIPVYLPVMDSQTGRAIGVVKAVVDVTAIKMEL
jgi:hypothetical protein